MSPRSLGWRIFLTCWVIYALHFATDVAREHYLVMSIVEDQTFRLDPYLGLHADIFENPPNAPHPGAHHGANPGISMVATVPYFVLRPAVDAIVARTLAARGPGDTTAVYNDPRPRRVEFYRRVRELGLDVRFGLVTAISHVFTMAPLTALSVVIMFLALYRLGLGGGLSTGLALFYGFGTPVFFRTAYLNQNLGIAVFALLAFFLLWDPGNRLRWSVRTRYLVAGLLGGLCILSDYSGALAALLLGLYGWWRRRDFTSWRGGFRDALWYAAGVVPGVLVLWWYQWASFGNAFYPPQQWMRPVEWIDVGYQGVGGFSPELLGMLLAEPRFGLFASAPAMLLALAAPWLLRRGRSFLPRREMILCFAMSAAFILFFATVQYTRLQWVTGFRYLAPIVPFLFLPLAVVLVRLPRAITWAVVLVSVILTWSMAMVRSQGPVWDNVVQVFVQGFQLPWLTVLGKMATQYLPWLQGAPSPLPFFVATGAVVALIWGVRRPWSPLWPDPNRQARRTDVGIKLADS